MPPKKNTEIEKRVADANRVLLQCRQRQLDPVEALKRAIKNHDRREQGKSK